MKKAKDLAVMESLQHEHHKEIPQQDTIRIIPYWRFAFDRFALFV